MKQDAAHNGSFGKEGRGIFTIYLTTHLSYIHCSVCGKKAPLPSHDFYEVQPQIKEFRKKHLKCNEKD